MNYYKRENNTVTMFDEKGNPIMVFEIPEDNGSDYQSSMIPVLTLDDEKVKQMPYTIFREMDL